MGLRSTRKWASAPIPTSAPNAGDNLPAVGDLRLAELCYPPRMSELRQVIEEALAKSRSRTSWNERLTHWERPASDHEEAKIERAARMVRNIVTNNEWLTGEGVSVCPQGSYFNNTNVRVEADMDVRVQHPSLKVIYHAGVDEAQADEALGYTRTGKSLSEIMATMRAELERDLVAVFGEERVDASGNKAIRVDGLDGSRADCDVVPAFTLHIINTGGGSPFASEGVAILGRDGSWTMNFPDQHHANGKAKRSRTAHRFKKNVRMLKRLNYELADTGAIAKRLPSFFVECLVYAVEDPYFLVEEDDRFDRLLRILYRARELLQDAAWAQEATEINEIKYLFRDGQAWTLAQARAFVDAAIGRMEAV